MRMQLRTIGSAIIFGLFMWAIRVNFANAEIRAKVIYGDDNRQEYYQLQNPMWKQKADATMALIRTTSLDPAGLITNIKTAGYGLSMGLCSSEPYYEQETAAFCSGFLVTPDTVVTAGHCVRSQGTCETTRFVFGFKLKNPAGQPRSVPSQDVYSCAKLVHSIVTPTGEDFAVVKLDRPVEGVEPLKIRATGKVTSGEDLVVMGHPAGLPLKIADKAQVRTVKQESFSANLDTYGGNSGSAVLNATTGLVEGILVRGEVDFVYDRGCRVSNVCKDNTCRGEDVTLIERVLPFL